MRRFIALRMFVGLFAALFLVLSICCPPVRAAKGGKSSGQSLNMNDKLVNSKSPIKITADRMVANQDRRTIIFEGHVIVRQEDLKITSNQLKVVLISSGGRSASDTSAPAEKIDYIEFTGNVKYTQQDRVATAQRAIFYQKEQKIVLYGKPVVTKGQDRIEGNLITIYVKQGRSVVEGGNGAQVNAVLYPEKKE